MTYLIKFNLTVQYRTIHSNNLGLVLLFIELLQKRNAKF